MAWFGKKKPALPTSGHAGDDMVLQQMVKQGADLGEPRHWVHYLYFPDESTARDAAAGVLLWAPPAADVVVRGRP